MAPGAFGVVLEGDVLLVVLAELGGSGGLSREKNQAIETTKASVTSAQPKRRLRALRSVLEAATSRSRS